MTTLDPDLQEAWDTVKELARMCCSEKHRELLQQLDTLIQDGMMDSRRLDYLNSNFFHREMDDLDKKVRPNQTMWVTFGPSDVCGDIRRVIDAQLVVENEHEKETL